MDGSLQEHGGGQRIPPGGLEEGFGLAGILQQPGQDKILAHQIRAQGLHAVPAPQPDDLQQLLRPVIVLRFAGYGLPVLGTQRLQLRIGGVLAHRGHGVQVQAGAMQRRDGPAKGVLNRVVQAALLPLGDIFQHIVPVPPLRVFRVLQPGVRQEQGVQRALQLGVDEMEPLQQHGPGILRQGSLCRRGGGVICYDLPQGRIVQGLQRQKRRETCVIQLPLIGLQVQLALPGEALLGLAAVPLHQQQPQRLAPVLLHQLLHPLAQLLGVLLHIVGNQQRGLGQFGGQRRQVSVIPPGQPLAAPAWGQLLLKFIGQPALAAAARPHDGPPAKRNIRLPQKFLQ